MALPKDTRNKPTRSVSNGVNSAKEAAGVLRDGISLETSTRGRSASVRLPRDIKGQNRTGLGNPWR